MKSNSLFSSMFSPILAALVVAGCASSGEKSSTPASPNKFQADDGRVIDIGKSSPSEGGLNYNNPHMEKGKCWVAGDFNFAGYDTLYIAPTVSTAKFPDKPEDTMVHNLAKERLVSELILKLGERRLFTNVVTKESEIKPDAKVLKMENTITEFAKGGGAARYFVGLYGVVSLCCGLRGK